MINGMAKSTTSGKRYILTADGHLIDNRTVDKIIFIINEDKNKCKLVTRFFNGAESNIEDMTVPQGRTTWSDLVKKGYEI